MNKLFKITMGAAILAMFACSDDSSSDTVGGGSWEDPNAIASDTSGVANDTLPPDTIRPPKIDSSDVVPDGPAGDLNPEGMDPGHFWGWELDTIANFEVVPGSIEPTVKAILDTSWFAGGNVYEFKEYLGAYSVCKTNGTDEIRIFKVDSSTSTYRTYLGVLYWGNKDANGKDGFDHKSEDYGAFRKACEDNGGTLVIYSFLGSDHMLRCDFKFDDKADLEKIWRGYADEFYDQCVELSKDYVPFVPPKTEYHCATSCEVFDGIEECAEVCPAL